MKADAKSLRFLGESPQKLTVPFFQRHYVWKKENWEELLASLESSEVKPFLGSIILKITNSLSPSEANIVDGQQRLTTLTILAKAIYDTLPKDEEGSGVRRDIESFLFYRKNASDKFINSHIKIEHSRTDIEDYTRVIKAGLGLLTNDDLNYEEIQSNSGLILNCYKYFREELKKKTIEELNNLHDSMFNDTRRILVLIILEHDDVNEQTIFDTINRAGERLSAADIIKNNIFKKCLDKCEEAEQDRNDVCIMYDDKWANLFYTGSEDDNIWDERRIFGNVQKTNLEFLLYCVACIKWGKQKEIFSGLEKVYSDETEHYDYWQLAALIREINEYGKLYKKYVLDLQADLCDEENTKVFKYDNHIERLLLILEKFRVQMFYPYVLKRIKDVNNDIKNTDLIRDFQILESFVVRRRLSPQGVSDYATKCDMIIRNGIKQLIATDFSNSDSVLRDTDIRSYVLKINQDTAKMMLFCIELHERRGATHEVNALEYKFTLEHIMPKSWKSYWKDVPLYDEDGNPYLPITEESENIRNAHVQSLGNLTLLTTSLNSSIKNHTFDTKINGSGPNRGYDKHTSLYLTKAIVEQYYGGVKVWDERQIRIRTKELCDKILNLWPSFSDQIDTQSKSNGTSINSSENSPSISPSIDEFEPDVFDDPIKLLRELEKKQ